MEKVNFLNSKGLKLVGNFNSSDSQSIIIMCNGFTSDKSSKGRFDLLAQTFNHCGFGVLAFDFSGSGESDDDGITLAKRIDDLNSAIKYVKEKGYRNIGLYGHSLGSRVCLEAYNTEDIKTIVLTGALTGPVTYNWSEHFTENEMEELKEKGYMTIQSTSKFRHSMIIEKQMLMDFEQCNQEELLKRIQCPVLVINGDGDWEERLLSKISKRGMQWLPKESQFKIIRGANHSFLNELSTIEECSTHWYKKYLSV